MERFKPMLLSTIVGYESRNFVNDLVAGIIVAIVALPLSIALALASGVGPEEGLYTAIVAGFIISLLGGCRVQIAGPTAAFATMVAGIVATKGMNALMIATIMAGLLLIIMGLCRLGRFIKYIPKTIVEGFTAGIAFTILVGQLKDFCGVSYPAGHSPIETMEKIEAFIAGISSFNWWALLVGAISLAVLILWPKVCKIVPASLIAILVGVAMVGLLKLPVNTIGDLYSVSNALPSFRLPNLNTNLLALVPDAISIAILASIESLLTCVVADGMINDKHRSNTELVAQGLGNIGSALMGGIPATGAIARTAANIKSGGRTPVAGIIHAVVLLIILVVLMPLAAMIPMPTIAAVLFVVAYNMSGLRSIKKLAQKAPKTDFFVLLLTLILTIVFDLVVAIAVGMVVHFAIYLARKYKIKYRIFPSKAK